MTELDPLVFVLNTWDDGAADREEAEQAAINLRRLLLDQQVDCDFATTTADPSARSLSVPDIGRLVVKVIPVHLARLLTSLGRFIAQGGGKVRIEIDLTKSKAILEAPASTSPADIQQWVASVEHALKRSRARVGH